MAAAVASTPIAPTAAAAGPAVDVIVNNHNYGRFLGAAVESALAQTYDHVSVIVVDDGSTDESRVVMASFANRIVQVLKDQGGQASAFEAGLERSRGDIVLFLDADDVLVPHAAERIAAAFREQPGLARVHFRLAVADETGKPTGELKPAPHIRLPSGDLRAAELRFPFDLARPATSGNAFARSALQAIRPIRDCGDGVGADWYVVHLCTLLGPVAAIDEPLALYRLHGANLHEGAQESLDLDRVRATIGYTARTRTHLADFAHRLGLEFRPDDASMSEVADRAISLKLEPALHPIPGDTMHGIVSLGVRAAIRRYDIATPMKAAFVAWLACLAVSPRRLARSLAELFVFPGKRAAINPWLRRTGRR
jgi:glycosyltransferase involved in cell wall biosynthesis